MFLPQSKPISRMQLQGRVCIRPCKLPDLYRANFATLALQSSWHFPCEGSMPVMQGGKAKLSAHMGELVESDFTHKSENTKPNKQSGKKVSKAVRQY